MSYTSLIEEGLQSLDNNDYDAAICKFIQAYNETTDINNKESILGAIIDNFVEPNEQEFQKAYSDNINYIIKKGWLENIKIPDISELSLVMIPVSEDRYYIWDTETSTFYGNTPVDLSSYRNIESRLIFESILIDGFADLRDILPEIIKNEYSHTYILLNNHKLVLDFFSYMQIPNIFESVKSDVSIFSTRDDVYEYLDRTGNYIPRLYKMARNYNYRDVMEELHAKRLINPRKRRPFLSICIPTYNRGESLYNNINNIIKLDYDEEIEIVIVNHGDTDEYYEKVKSLSESDSRLLYIECKVDDFCKAMNDTFSRPNGQFAVLCTDEDHIINEAIPGALQCIYEKKNYSALFFPSINEKNQVVDYGDYKDTNDIYLKIIQALSAIKLTGICINMDIYKEYDVLNETYSKWKDNYYYKIYPQAINTIYLILHGDMGVGEVLFSSASDARDDYVGGKYIWHYQTLESRIKQMKALVNIILDIDVDPTTIVNTIMSVQGRTFLLLEVAYNVHRKDMLSFHSWEESCNQVKKEIDYFWDNPNSRFSLTENDRKDVKDTLDKIYNDFLTDIQ